MNYKDDIEIGDLVRIRYSFYSIGRFRLNELENDSIGICVGFEKKNKSYYILDEGSGVSCEFKEHLEKLNCKIVVD